MTYLCIDTECTRCGAKPRLRTCVECGTKAFITDCGHQTQPRPISAGRADGTEIHRDFCEACCDAHAATEPA
jgi:hypothetical protein